VNKADTSLDINLCMGSPDFVHGSTNLTPAVER